MEEKLVFCCTTFFFIACGFFFGSEQPFWAVSFFFSGIMFTILRENNIILNRISRRLGGK